jgi:methylmalonyl-CoA/ethylmalonyl-CoA epimerase
MIDGMTFDHVGIVVADMEKGLSHLRNMLPLQAATRRFDDHKLTVSVQFARDSSGMVYELIAPIGPSSVVAQALSKKRDLLNQIAYRAGNVAETVSALRRSGCFPLGEACPAIAFGGALVQFLLTPLGFVLELIEQNGHQHEFGPIPSQQGRSI